MKWLTFILLFTMSAFALGESLLRSAARRRLDGFGGTDDVPGCMDANADNYNADATVQGYDQYGNLACNYGSCDDIPDAEGCFYAENYSPFKADFSAAECVSYGGTACTSDDSGSGGSDSGTTGGNTAQFTGAFGGATVDGDTFTFPTDAESWAGFANENANLYPLEFTEAGSITFTGSVADGVSADVRFRLEFNPFPDVEPSFNTETVTVSGADTASYTVAIPSQGVNTFSSFLLYVVTPDVAVTITDVVVNTDTGDDSGVEGCMDANADNYNADATLDDGSCTYTAAPTLPTAPVPTEAADDVLSVFSTRYGNLAGTDFNPNWNQATSVDSAGENLAYTNLDYQGTQFASPLDVSGYGYLHVSYYVVESTSLNFYLISTGPVETAVALGLTAGQWNNVQIPLSHYDNVDLADVIQFKVDGNGDVQFNNLYFTNTAHDSGSSDPDQPDQPGNDDTVSVTFQVDMSAVNTHADGVYLAGGGVFGQDGVLLTDDGSDVWSATVQLDQNTQVLYKFRNQPSYGGWDGFEDATGLIVGGCVTGQYSDRFVDVVEADITLDVVAYGSCTADPYVSSAPAVSFTVSASGATEVKFHSSGFNWDPTAQVVATNNGDGTWTATVDPGFGVQTEYKWIVDGVEEDLSTAYRAGECADDNVFGYDDTWFNRYWEFGSGDVTGDVAGACSGKSGCMDATACNYYAAASVAGDCTYAAPGYDCSGVCLDDADEDGVCDADEAAGCTDANAANYNADATDDDGSCLPIVDTSAGCTDATALNYNADATDDDGSCLPIVDTSGVFGEQAGVFEFTGFDQGNQWVECYPLSNEDYGCNSYNVVPLANSITIDYVADQYIAVLHINRVNGGTLGLSGDMLQIEAKNAIDVYVKLEAPNCWEGPEIKFGDAALIGPQTYNIAIANLINRGCTNGVQSPITNIDQVTKISIVMLAPTPAHTFIINDIRVVEVTDVSGCTDPDAENFDSGATTDDGSCTYTAAPTLPMAPVPTEAPDDVLSIFGTTYGNLDGTDFNPGWGQSTSVEVGDNLVYTNLNYQGTQFANQDVSVYGYLHVSYYVTESTPLNFFLIGDGGETFVSLDVSTTDQWVNVQIPLSSYSDVVNLADVFQFKVEGNGQVAFNNLYFTNTAHDSGGNTDVEGCMDANADNYNADATVQAFDQYGNLVCTYNSCDDIPEYGCIYADGFGAFNEDFDAAACSSYGGTPCTSGDSGNSDGSGDSGSGDVEGCMDANADDYNADATVQGYDQYGDILCVFVSCADIPDAEGCIYAFDGSYSPFKTGFTAADCTNYNGMPCTSVEISFTLENGYTPRIGVQDGDTLDWCECNNIVNTEGAQSNGVITWTATIPQDKTYKIGRIDGQGTLSIEQVVATVDGCTTDVDGDTRRVATEACKTVDSTEFAQVDDSDGGNTAQFTGAFGGATVDGDTFTFPTDAESWAGFANENANLYPLEFTEAGSITFTGSVADGVSADVRFRLEFNPYPDVEPSFNTETVTVSGADTASYTVAIPSQGVNTFSSFLLYVVTPDVAVTITDVVVNTDTGDDSDGTPACVLGTVYISEAHGKGDPEDYIEIYNSGDAGCSMAGFQLTDSSDSTDDFTFGDVVIEAGGYWLGQEDEDNSFTFGISKGGERIDLVDSGDAVLSVTTLDGDIGATNFADDGTSCLAEETPDLANADCYVLGCTNPAAPNYNPNANMDDGSCEETGVDCAGAWSACSAVCESGSERTFTITTEPSGTGDPCPQNGPDCQHGEDDCVYPDQVVSVKGDPKFSETASVTIKYDVSDDSASLTGLGLRVHYDSSVLTFVEASDVLVTDLIDSGTLAVDAGNDDNDSVTDTYVSFAWASLFGGWPGTLPADLVTLNFDVAADVTADKTPIKFSSSSNAAGYVFKGIAYDMPILVGSWDFDDNGVGDALTDGLLFLRYAFGLTGDTLTNDVIASDSPLAAAEVEANVATAAGSFGNIDGNENVDALTDGLLLLRYMFGLTGDTLTNGAVGGAATRTTAADIEAYIVSLMP